MNLAVNDEIILPGEDGEDTFFTLEYAVKRAQKTVKKYLKEDEKFSEQLIANRRNEAGHE